MTTPLNKIVEAVNAEAMHYENAETATAQVSSIERVCSFNDVDYFVVRSVTFRRATSFYSHFTVVADGASIQVLTRWTAEDARENCYACCDYARKVFDEEAA